MKIWQRTRSSIGLLLCQIDKTFSFTDVAIFVAIYFGHCRYGYW